MQFEEALKLMMRGKKMKLPSWNGYWMYDNNKKTIMIHTKDNYVIDIRDTKDVIYTLINVVSDEWEEATTENCGLLGGIAKFNIQTALKYAKEGISISSSLYDETKMIDLFTNSSYDSKVSIPLSDININILLQLFAEFKDEKIWHFNDLIG